MARLVGAAVAVALAAGCGSPDRRFWTLTPNEVAVLLKVATMPSTHVRVLPPLGSGRDELWLGRTPIFGAEGAFVGDTVRFENEALCIRHEETIAFGEPGQERSYQKVFSTGMVKVRGGSGEVWCNGRFIGSADRWILVGTGAHALELKKSHGGRIALPPVEIRPQQETEVFVPIGKELSR